MLRARSTSTSSSKRRRRATRRRPWSARGDRAEKIRTYNFPQNRVTDHRIGLTLHNLSTMLEGNLDPLLDALSVAAEKEPEPSTP